jgi:hypothetical protein
MSAVYVTLTRGAKRASYLVWWRYFANLTDDSRWWNKQNTFLSIPPGFSLTNLGEVMKAKILAYALPALILTTIHFAGAQQAGKSH